MLKEWDYERSVLNIVYVLTKAKFRNLAITKYLTNGKSEIIYGAVGYNFGYYSDIEMNCNYFKYFGAWKTDIYAFLKLFNLHKREAKVYYTDKPLKEQKKVDLTNVKDFLKDNEYLKDWEQSEDNLYNFMYLTSPEWTVNENISSNRKLGDDFGEIAMSGEKEGFVEFLKSLIKIGDKGEGDASENEVKKVRSFRVELNESEKKTTPVWIDGEVYDGTVVQGSVIGEQRVRIIA